ncbi:MAG: ABC transporter ATP-binding protein [Clostridiales bacterium]|nr:ABC transporter ATP-binding protein [Clostridiales bacterium]
MNLLELKDITLTYFSDNGETKALENISFNVNDGEFISIVGPSGCGKTTILSLISGLIKPTSGEVIINQNDNFYAGYMFQKDNLFEWRTVLDNVYLGLEIRKMKTAENIEYANDLLKKYNLWEFRNKYPKQLSGGMRQRVALIRTLALKPSILLLDEAFSALDYQTRLNICDDVYSIIKQMKLTAILVTHDISEAISLSDKIIILSSRPATVKKEISLNLNNIGTPLKRRECPQAKEYFETIWSELM